MEKGKLMQTAKLDLEKILHDEKEDTKKREVFFEECCEECGCDIKNYQDVFEFYYGFEDIKCHYEQLGAAHIALMDDMRMLMKGILNDYKDGAPEDESEIKEKLERCITFGTELKESAKKEIKIAQETLSKTEEYLSLLEAYKN